MRITLFIGCVIILLALYGWVLKDDLAALIRKGKSTMAAETFPLADLIEEVSAQLRDARERYRTKGEDALLEFASCTLELGVALDKKGEGGIDIKVVKLGGALDKTNTQTITVVLEAPTTPLASSRSTMGYLPRNPLILGIRDPEVGQPAIWPPVWEHVHGAHGGVHFRTLAGVDEDEGDEPDSRE